MGGGRERRGKIMADGRHGEDPGWVSSISKLRGPQAVNDTSEVSLSGERELGFRSPNPQSLVKGLIAGGEVGIGICALFLFGRNRHICRPFKDKTEAARGTTGNSQRDPGDLASAREESSMGMDQQEENVQGDLVPAGLNLGHSGQRV